MNLDQLTDRIGDIHDRAQAAAGRSVDRLLTTRNWVIGAYIVQYEQDGEDRAAYGEGVIDALAARLQRAGYAGLSSRNLLNYRQFALAWPGVDIVQLAAEIAGPSGFIGGGQISQTVSAKSPAGEEAPISLLPSAAGGGLPSLAHRYQPDPALPWRNRAWFYQLFSALSFSHLLELGRIEEPLPRAFYELQTVKCGWSFRELRRQRGSLLYERVGLSKDKDAVMALSREGVLTQTPAALLQDPYVLEFLGLEGRARFSEGELEAALLEHLQAFLLELGHDFCFMGRQFRVTVGGRHHFIDLLFYHRGLRCLVAIDLKIEPFQHEHAGQMNFYLSFLADQVARPDENAPVGIVLCTDKDAAEVHYATAGLPHAVFVSRYLVALPSEALLARWLREERAVLETKREREP